MSELKPAAWRKKYSGDKKWRYEETGYIGDWDVVERLYTAEQLHQRVKMTQAEFDEFNHLYLFYPSLYNVLYHVNHSPEDYPILNKKLFDEYPRCTAAQKIFSNLHNNFDPDHPEETIEILPTMKWFVRSKKVVGENNFYAWLFNNDFLDVPAHMISDKIPPLAMKFDTKEQAEQWKNPLTEAVLLPIEGDD